MVDRKAIHDLVDKVLDVREQTDHYVSVEIKNYGSDISVWVMKGGWDKDKDFDLYCRPDIEDADGLGTVIVYLDGLLNEKDPRRMKPSEVQRKNNTVNNISQKEGDCKDESI